ncbi:YheC/YheD family protein [Halalkalibacter lacteus]|uniref:YheC/YheD family endospore coat-associated protein n=1 Tax=Halalkalibacter lacteus TaxID=3090663 RepID=UPI002FC6A389
MYIKWITTWEVDEVYFPENFQRAEMASSDKINFHFGSWKRELSVRFIEDLPNDTIGLSRNLKDDVFIPDDISYETNITKDSVSLGPVILYLISKRLIKRLDKLKARIENFSPFNGLIFISTVSGINTEQQTIEGYYLQPSSDTSESNWEKGIFPYPGAIFKRVPLPNSINEHLYEMTNGCIFNSKFFSKWEMWEWLAPDKFIRNHLPYTTELTTLDEINNMLDVFQSIYLKPKNGSGGKGIIQIKRDDQSLEITAKNQVTKVDSLDQHPIFESVLKRKNQYMIQQGVPLKHDSRNVDFRIYMQKDETTQWKCSGLIARFSKPGSITTNLRYLDYLLPGKEAFEQLFGLDQDEMELLEQKVVNICIKACQLLDQHGCYGDVAIDFILDNDLHVWILEINKRYGYKSFSLINDSNLYGEIIRNPFLYASAIAGFSSVNKLQNELEQKLSEKITNYKLIRSESGTITNYKLIRNVRNASKPVLGSRGFVVYGKKALKDKINNEAMTKEDIHLDCTDSHMKNVSNDIAKTGENSFNKIEVQETEQVRGMSPKKEVDVETKGETRIINEDK